MSGYTEHQSTEHRIYYTKLQMEELQQKLGSLEASYGGLTRYYLTLEYQQQANNLQVLSTEATFRSAGRMLTDGVDSYGPQEAHDFEKAASRYNLWKEAERAEKKTGEEMEKAIMGLDDIECDIAVVKIELVHLKGVMKELEKMADAMAEFRTLNR